MSGISIIQEPGIRQDVRESSHGLSQSDRQIVLAGSLRLLFYRTQRGLPVKQADVLRLLDYCSDGWRARG